MIVSNMHSKNKANDKANNKASNKPVSLLDFARTV